MRRWRILSPSFRSPTGKPRVDDKRVLSGIIFINRNGLRWRDAPAAKHMLAAGRNPLRQMPQALPVSLLIGRSRHVLVMNPDPRCLVTV